MLPAAAKRLFPSAPPPISPPIMHWLLILILALTQSPGTPVPTLPLEIQAIDEATGKPIPNAQVRWLDAVTHQNNRDSQKPDWPSDPLKAVEEFGHPIQCNGDGKTSFEAPLGGIYLSVQTEESFAFVVAPSGSQKAKLLAEPDVDLVLIASDPDGNPITGVRAWITSSWGRRSKRVTSATTDDQGQAHFPHAQYRIFGTVKPTAEYFQQGTLRVDLDVLGGDRVRTIITHSHWQARRIPLTTPPLGYVEILPSTDLPTNTFSGQRFFIAEDPLPEAKRTGSTSSRHSLFAAAHLGLRFQVSVVGGPIVTVTQQSFRGPTEAQERVQVGPLTPIDHVSIKVLSGLNPNGDFPNPRFLNTRLRGETTTVVWGRARVMQSDLESDGSFTVRVPSGFCDDPFAVLDVELWAGGKGLGNGVVRGGSPSTDAFPIVPPEARRVRWPDPHGLARG